MMSYPICSTTEEYRGAFQTSRSELDGPSAEYGEECYLVSLTALAAPDTNAHHLTISAGTEESADGCGRRHSMKT